MHVRVVTVELVGIQVSQGSAHTAGQVWLKSAERRAGAFARRTDLVVVQMEVERMTLYSVEGQGRTLKYSYAIYLAVEGH
jgi:hypothetical protein